MILGGAIYAIGNSWNTAAEFNIYVDPEAAATVFNKWGDILLVPWETVMKCPLRLSQYQGLAAIQTPKAEFFRRIFQGKFDQ